MYLEHGELHIAVLYLICSYDLLERIDQFLRVVPLHAGSAQNHSRLLRAGCLRIDPSSFKMLPLGLIRRHQASLVGDGKLHATSD